MTPDAPDLEALRQAAQLALLASGDELEVGSACDLPYPRDALVAVHGDEPWVRERLDAGLTAVVYRLRGQPHDWTLKRARARPRVLNVDGQTSFLNEVQRRADLQALKRQPGGAERWRGIVDTQYASLRHGILLSPWIEGSPVTRWDERTLTQLLETVCALWAEGLFEWDLCPGNVLDDGHQVMLFDFGYMYRFDPRQHFNSAGSGRSAPLFHPAERFETRNLSAVLLALEHDAGAAPALTLFRQAKALALDAYRRMRSTVAGRGAAPEVLGWIDGIVARWAEALRGDAGALYRAEMWRSHALDLADDLHGQSCTPTTLRRADWLLQALDEDFDALRALGAFFGDDAGLPQTRLRERYVERRRRAEALQVARRGP